VSSYEVEELSRIPASRGSSFKARISAVDLGPWTKRPEDSFAETVQRHIGKGRSTRRY